jgi:XRE family transcriptional regulator, regulator of sulfur utilization
LQDINRIVGERIRKIRREKGITQDHLAELAGLNRVHLYRLENGKQSMTLDTLKILADTLGVSVGRLLSRI